VWIKVYSALDDDYEFCQLDDIARSHLQAIWRLAARTENRIPHDPAWICRSIHATSPVDVDALVKAGWLEPSRPVSDDSPKPCMNVDDALEHPAPPFRNMHPRAPAHSRETETEVEAEAQDQNPLPQRSSPARDPELSTPPPREDRGRRNGWVKDMTPEEEGELAGTIERLREHPPGEPGAPVAPPADEKPRFTWFGDEDRWCKVERAIAFLWTAPVARQQMLQMAATVPKARRDGVNSSADETEARRREGSVDLSTARKDLIAAVNGGTP
jgi:hypothetical protein